jgi:hypothetical protein
MPDRTFMKITNKDIYKKLEDIEEHVIKTNGKVMLNRWIASTALGLIVGLCSILLVYKIW